MKTFKQLMALLLVFVLVAACVPLGTITAFAADNDETDISAADTEIDAKPEESTEPAETENEGYLAPEIYQSQTRQMQKQLNELKEERQDQFESRILAMLQEVRKLKSLIDEIEEPLDEFDEKLFEEIVMEMSLNHADELTITLLGGLKFTELI